MESAVTHVFPSLFQAEREEDAWREIVCMPIWQQETLTLVSAEKGSFCGTETPADKRTTWSTESTGAREVGFTIVYLEGK